MNSKTTDGYLAIPTTGKGRPVLVLHAWWGLNDTIRQFCIRLAEQGFVAFAPDLYQGKVTDTIEGAEELSQSMDEEKANASIEAAAAFLSQHPATASSGIAVIGFSLGAYFALKLSNDIPDQIHSVVVFYGTGPTDFSRSHAAYLGHYAENDQFEPQSQVDGLKATLQQAGRQVTFYQYPDTGHWFFEPDRTQAYHPDAAALAWERTLEFLKKV
ncbi:MAG: dienelactone hydrolase family protein [Anaerolineales bacterium]